MKRMFGLLLLFVLVAGCQEGVKTAGDVSDTSSFDWQGNIKEFFIKIEKPEEGAVFNPGKIVKFDITTNCVKCEVQLESSIDGILFRKKVTSSGHVTDEFTKLHTGVHKFTATLFSPYDEELAEAEVSIRINTPPTAPSGEVSPEDARTTDDIYFKMSKLSFDADGDEVSYKYRWFRGEELILESSSNKLSSVLTKKGKNYKVSVIPYDPYTEGESFTVKFEILNTKPEVSTVAILPSSGYKDTEFSCKYYDYTDPDKDDPQKVIYRWYKNDAVVKEGEEFDVFPEEVKKHDVLKCSVVPYDGEEYGEEKFSDKVVVKNSPPEAGSVVLTPDEPEVGDTLKCEVSDIVDADGDEVSVKYKWIVSNDDGEKELPGETGSEVSGSIFKKGDEVWCRVIPFDGEEDGAPVDSNHVLIKNSPPSIVSVFITPAEAKEGDELKCEFSNLSDPDGDQVSVSYRWEVNGEEVLGQNGDTLTSEFFDKGDTVFCFVKPFDGTDYGVEVKSKNSAVIKNTPPVVTGVLITPEEGGKNTEFSCNYETIVDPDPLDSPDSWLLNSDPQDIDKPGIIYRWYRNDELVEGETGSSMIPEDFKPGDSLKCGIVAFDGQDFGEEVFSSQALIINHKPKIEKAVLSPEEAYETSVLTCKGEGFYDEDGDEPQFFYKWFVMDKELTDETKDVLTGKSFQKGDIVYCEVTPFDGFEEGAPKTSNVVTIKNSPPSISGVKIEPATGNGNTQFSCTPLEYADPDGDEITFFYAWYLNDQKIEGETSSTYTPKKFKTGDKLKCSVTPFDGEDKGNEGESFEATLINLPPSIEEVSIFPEEIYTDTEVTCKATGVLDPEDDDVTLSYKWFVNGNEISGEASESLNSSYFKKGDKIVCTVTPFDLEHPGKSVSSDVVVVLNSPPVPPELEVLPESPKSSDSSIVCNVVKDAVDKDGDELTLNFKWFRKGDSEPFATESSFSPEFLESCDEFFCAVEVTDGEASVSATSDSKILDGSMGANFNGTTSTIVVPDSDSLHFNDGIMTVELWFKTDQSASKMFLFSKTGGENGIFLYIDSDDFINFELKNGESKTVTKSTTKVSAGSFFHVAAIVNGQIVKLFVNGNLEGAGVFNKTLENQGDAYIGSFDGASFFFKGVIDELRISDIDRYSSNFTPEEILSADENCVLLFHFENIKQGENIKDYSQFENNGIPSDISAVSGMCGYVTNNPPTPPVVEVIPKDPGDDDDLYCNIVTNSTDPDGDVVTYKYFWYKNGVLQTDLTDSKTVTADLTGVGDVWQCSVIASDGKNDVSASDSVKIKDGGGFVPSGTYSISPSINYQCAYGLVNLNYSLLTFIDDGATLSVSPEMNGCCELLGASAKDGSITVSCTCPGACDEIYTLTGNFTDNDTWEGTLKVNFQGDWCWDCVPQTFTITGSRL